MYFAKYYCKLSNPPRLALLYAGCINLFDGNLNKMMMTMMSFGNMFGYLFLSRLPSHWHQNKPALSLYLILVAQQAEY